MAQSRKFAKTRTGHGVTGMELNLNLTQCEVLNLHGEEIKKALADDNKELLVQTATALLPFLELFDQFQNRHDPNLWVNEDYISE